jgi:uncharacterized membrane protein YoaK (UPF0700 family)
MRTFLAEFRETLAPDRSGPFGPLPPLFIVLTLVTGLVDAFSYLVLGHVFVANMTGNVVFLGFAVAGAHGFSIGASLVALLSFAAGSVIGGRIVVRYGHHRGRHLAVSMAVQSAFLLVAVALAIPSADPPQSGFRYALIVVLSLATGGQNASARKLAVPDLTTTVLTMTVTGLAADSVLGGGKGSKSGRRSIALAAMFLGALVGALLVLHVGIVLPLTIALALTLFVGSASYAAGRSDPVWTRADAEAH